MPNHAPLDMPTVLRIAEVANAKHKKVRYLRDPNSDQVLEGVVREVTPFDGRNETGARDVRDQFLHISATMEHWVPMAEVLDALTAHRMFFS